MSTASVGHLPKKNRQTEKKGMDAISQKWILIAAGAGLFGIAAFALLIVGGGIAYAILSPQKPPQVTAASAQKQRADMEAANEKTRQRDAEQNKHLSFMK